MLYILKIYFDREMVSFVGINRDPPVDKAENFGFARSPVQVGPALSKKDIPSKFFGMNRTSN